MTTPRARAESSAAATASPQSSPPTPIVDGFALVGVSRRPDPATHAYRPDLADTALAGTVIASHYADPLERTLIAQSDARATPTHDGEVIATVAKGDVLRMLDCSRGWAWGYIPDGRVGYLPAAALGL